MSAFLALIGALVVPVASRAPAATADVLRVETTPTLGCVVAHRDDPKLSFYGTVFAGQDGATESAAACGTFVGIGGRLYGPAATPAMFAVNTTRAAAEWGVEPTGVFTPVDQQRSGAGTDDAPYRVVTRVRAGTTGIEVVQTDEWTATTETVRTRIDVFNRSSRGRAVSLYRAGDCQTEGYASYGTIGIASAACLVAVPDGPGRDVARLVPGDSMIELWGPMARPVVDIRAIDSLGAALDRPMTAGRALRRTCTECDPGRATDRSLALGWRVSISARSSLTFRTAITITTGPARSTSSIEAVVPAGAPGMVEATLRSDGRVLRDRTLRFLRDGAEVCRAETDASGRARCVLPSPTTVGDPAGASLAGAATVDVMFDGELEIRPSATWVVLGPLPAVPGTLPPAPGCVPTNNPTAAGSAPGSGQVILQFAQASCPTVRYTFIPDGGGTPVSIAGNGTPRLVLELGALDTGRLVLSRFRQPGVELFSTPVAMVSPGKAIG